MGLINFWFDEGVSLELLGPLLIWGPCGLLLFTTISAQKTVMTTFYHAINSVEPSSKLLRSVLLIAFAFLSICDPLRSSWLLLASHGPY
jgi:hypothetical protein